MVADNGLVKVADFGTSRFLELAAHGTTVIGSPPYMAPEQFHGRATFASDIYSLGVTMYQMMTGMLPYHTPAPADLERLMRGEMVSPPRTAQRPDPAAHQRHHHEGDGARRDGALSDAPPRCSRTCSAPSRTRPRRGRPTARSPCPRPAPDPGPGPRGHGTARRRSPGSAGTAASRCTPARTGVRSAGRRSRIRPPRSTRWLLRALERSG